MKSAARRKKGFGARVRPFWLPIGLAAVVAIAAGAFAVGWPGFRPRQVDVSGNAVVPRAEIVARAAVAPNVNMWLQSSRAMARRIEAIPYVLRARVVRVPPSSILIDVRERVPYAIVMAGTGTAVIDRALRVLQLEPVDKPLPAFDVPELDAPLVPGRFLTGTKIAALRDDYEAMIAARVVPLELSEDRSEGLVATMRGGTRILFGDDADLDKKLPLVDPILAQIVRKRSRVSAVDLRAPRTPVLVLK